MDHKAMLESNDQYIHCFVVKHVGNAQRLGKKLFEDQLDTIKSMHSGENTPPSHEQMALRAMSRASYMIGMYSVDHVNVLPYGSCVKALFGAMMACAEIVITKQRKSFWKSINTSVDKNMN